MGLSDLEKMSKYLAEQHEHKKEMLEYARVQMDKAFIPELNNTAQVAFDAAIDIARLNNKILHMYPYKDKAAVDADIKKLKDAVEYLNDLIKVKI
jgi:hypothetical protein